MGVERTYLRGLRLRFDIHCQYQKSTGHVTIDFQYWQWISRPKERNETIDLENKSRIHWIEFFDRLYDLHMWPGCRQILAHA